MTCGYQHLAEWRLKGNHLTCRNFITVEATPTKPEHRKEQDTPPTLMCLDFVSYKLGDSVDSDVVFGSDKGQLSTYTAGKHFFIEEAAHRGPINLIRVTDMLYEVSKNI